jgi:hypothetical protein
MHATLNIDQLSVVKLGSVSFQKIFLASTSGELFLD